MARRAKQFRTDSSSVLFTLPGSAICASTAVIASTASVNVRTDRVGGVYTNEGAVAAIILTLPTLVAGYTYCFVDNNATYRMSVIPADGDQMVWPKSLSAASPLAPVIVSGSSSPKGSAISTARYDSFWGVALDATSLVVVGFTGTWTLS